MTDKRMDNMFNDLGMDFSSIQSTIKENIKLNDSYCDVKAVQSDVETINKQITEHSNNINFQDLIERIRSKIG